MTDDKKLKDEELAEITGAGVPDLGDKKKPTGGGGPAGEGPDKEEGDPNEPSNWQPS